MTIVEAERQARELSRQEPNRTIWVEYDDEYQTCYVRLEEQPQRPGISTWKAGKKLTGDDHYLHEEGGRR
jgi:hypothetical protein